MSLQTSRPGMGTLAITMLMFAAGIYFAFAAIQGTYGVLARAEISAESDALTKELAALDAEVSRLENLTHRLSDDYLDLDLLDQQARDVLGLLRADELIIR